MTERPGIMLYFDMTEPLKSLEHTERGMLLEAMLDYGQYGIVPEFDGTLQFAWGFIRPKLDSDAKRYRKRVIKNTHSSYCAKEKKRGNSSPLDFDEWCEKENIDTTEWIRMESSDSTRYPTTIGASNATSYTISALNPSPYIAKDGDGKGCKGKEEEENITDETIASRTNWYLRKLEELEAQNGKQNHTR